MYIAKECWYKGAGKNGKGKKSDNKGKAQSKGSPVGANSLEETGKSEQEPGPEAEIHAIFALDALTPTGMGEGGQSGKGKGTGSTEVFIRSVLTNLKSVEAREIHRAKEELRKGVQDHDLQKKVAGEIAQRKDQLNGVLTSRSILLTGRVSNSAGELGWTNASGRVESEQQSIGPKHRLKEPRSEFIWSRDGIGGFVTLLARLDQKSRSI